MNQHSSKTIVIENADFVKVKYAGGEESTYFDNEVTEVILTEYYDY